MAGIFIQSHLQDPGGLGDFAVGAFGRSLLIDRRRRSQSTSICDLAIKKIVRNTSAVLSLATCTVQNEAVNALAVSDIFSPENCASLSTLLAVA